MAPKKQEARVKWAPFQQEVPVVPTTAVAALPTEQDGGSASDTASMVSSTTYVGDILYDLLYSDASTAAPAAAASGSGDRPPTNSTARLHRPKRETAPKTATKQAAKWDAVAAKLDEAEVGVGNIGWLFGNWGKRPRNQAMRKHLDMVLKRNPAMIIGLAECEAASEDLLGAPAVAGDPTAPRGSLERRDGFEYLTLRGCEDSSILVAVRNEMGNRLELLDWERRREGRYRRRSGRGRAEAYSRSLIARVHLDINVGFLGKTHVVMVVHMHNLLANNKSPTKLQEFWDWLALKVTQHGVRVLMGDFNMSLFRVIPELRDRGVNIDLGAWFPWKTPMGMPMSDSCGMFFINMPGEYTLTKGMEDLHAEPGGILHKAAPTVAGAAVDDGFDRIDPAGGPGMSIKLFLPKTESNWRKKLQPSLEPSPASSVATAGGKGRSCGKGTKGANDAGKDASMRTCIRIREKRLLAALWKCEGVGYKGSHFPICAFTKNVGRRSPERMRVRAEKAAARRGQSQSRQPWPRRQPWQEQQQHGQGQEQQQQQAAAAAREAATALAAAATAAAAAATAARGWLDYGDDGWRDYGDDGWRTGAGWRAMDSWRARGSRDCGDDGWRDCGEAGWRA